jgi:hypothetical protein
MIKNHLRTIKLHHVSNIRLHVTVVAMYSTFAACWLRAGKRAVLKSFFRIRQDSNAIITERLALGAGTILSAIDFQHASDCFELSFKPGMKVHTTI